MIIILLFVYGVFIVSCRDVRITISGLLTLILSFAAFEQWELGRIVHHGELPQQCFDDLSGPRAGADVQVFDRVSGQVEWGAVLQCFVFPTPAIPSRGGGGGGGGRAPWRRERHGPGQLELDLYEASVRSITVLMGKTTNIFTVTLWSLILTVNTTNIYII